MPVLIPQISSSGKISGNIYFDEGYNNIPADTYLYYVMEGSTANATDTSSADFYYSYTLYENFNSNSEVISYTYGAADTGNVSYASSTTVTVTIYGYKNVKTIASDTDATTNTAALGRTTSNFAAIKMTSGFLYVNNGGFYSYFGVTSNNITVSTAYCVSASGGTISVTSGTFEALGAAACVNCTDSSAALTVAGGDFFSYAGNMVQMSGGTMTVTGGTFTKDATGNTPSTLADGANNSAIEMDGGTLTVAGTDEEENAVVINLKGSYVNGIKCTSGTVSVTNAKFIYNGGSSDTSTDYTNNVGIANYGGTVEVTSCLFDTNDASSKGIKAESESGTVTAMDCYFVLSGEKSIGIYAEGGTVEVGKASDVANTICMFYIDHVASCYGIYASASSATIALNVNAAQFIMGQKYYNDDDENNAPDAYTTGSGDVINSAGIYLNATNGTLTHKRAVFMMAGSYSAGVYAKAGTINQVDIDGEGYTNAMLIGVTHSAYSGNGIYNDSFNESVTTPFYESRFGSKYFVAMYGANSGNGLYEASSSYYTSGSTLNSIQFTGLSATGSAIGSYGIFSEGGTIEADIVYVMLCSTYGAGLYSVGASIKVDDFECDVRSTDSTSTVYPGKSVLYADVSSSAVSLGTDSAANANNNNALGSVEIGESVVNTDAYGYNINTGSLTFTGSNTLNSVRATAIYVEGGNLNISSGATLTVTSNIGTQSGWDNPSGTLLTDYIKLNYTVTDSTENITYIQPDGIYITGGTLNSVGDLNMTFSGVNNNTSGTSTNDFNPQGNTMNSYALYVNAGSSDSVKIVSSTTQVSIGGGVYVSGGTVTLGSNSGADTDISITTTGNSYGTAKLGSTSNWGYYDSITGGHAVVVDGGTINIWCGTYVAYLGNGIFVEGGTAYVYGGSFTGAYSAGYQCNGFAAYYGLKLWEGGTFYSYGGTYQSGGNGNGGAFVTGFSSSLKATANIYGGTFINENGNNGFTIGVYCTVTFTTNLSGYGTNTIYVKGKLVAVALINNDLLKTALSLTSTDLSAAYAAVTLYIYTGTYVTTSTGDSEWTIWNNNNSASITLGSCTLVSSDSHWLKSTTNVSGYTNNSYLTLATSES